MGPRGVWDDIHEQRVGCGEVLKRERDLITDVDTVSAVVSSIAKSIYKVRALRIIGRYTEIMWDCSGTHTQINIGLCFTLVTSATEIQYKTQSILFPYVLFCFCKTVNCAASLLMREKFRAQANTRRIIIHYCTDHHPTQQ